MLIMMKDICGIRILLAAFQALILYTSQINWALPNAIADAPLGQK